MRIFHRLCISKGLRPEFMKVGIDLLDYQHGVTVDGPFVILRLDECDPKWLAVQTLDTGTEMFDILETEFSQSELCQAANICFTSSSFTGYPEPSGDNGYLGLTYDLSNYCSECGTGLRQKAPFRMKGEVKWGRRTTTQMHWIFDEIFVRPEIWKEVFEPFAIEYWPVHSRKGIELDSVVQLKIDALADLELGPDVTRQICRACGRVKYRFPERGYWPRPLNQPAPIFKSTQYFGDMHAADREMFVTQDLYQAMIKHKLNCRYWACASE